MCVLKLCLGFFNSAVCVPDITDRSPGDGCD